MYKSEIPEGPHNTTFWGESLGLCYHQSNANRPYAIPHVTKCETDSGQKSGYYAAILSGKEDRGIGA